MTPHPNTTTQAVLRADEPTSEVASVDDIRANFPALDRLHNGRPVAYFDGPGGTQVPRAVVDAIADYLYCHNANSHWNYPTSAETDAILDEAREAWSDYLGATPGEIVFGANSTTLTFHLSRAIGATLSAGDEIVVTELDHHCNVAPWQAIERERGCVLRMVKMDTKSGQLDWNDFESKVTARTKLVAVAAASNALGTIVDVPRAVRLARSAGALAFVDAVHYAPHQLVDFAAWDADFTICSAYKCYGPHVGVMAGRQSLLESLPFAKLQPAPNSAPFRAETGTLNHEGIAGAAAAVNFLAGLAPSDSRRASLASLFEALHERGQRFVETLWSELGATEGVMLYGPPPSAPRTSTIAFTVRDIPAADVAGHLADRGVFVSHGNFYAKTVVERLGLDDVGLVRAGCACYTTADEVHRLIAGVRELASK